MKDKLFQVFKSKFHRLECVTLYVVTDENTYIVVFDFDNNIEL